MSGIITNPEDQAVIGRYIAERRAGWGYPARIHTDDRRAFYGDVFPPIVTEVNIAVIAPNASAGAWHGHDRQDDYWFVARGLLHVGLKSEDASIEITMVQGSKVLHIASPVWHTYKAGPDGAVLVYGMTNKWDGTDEKRLAFTEAEAEVYG